MSGDDRLWGLGIEQVRTRPGVWLIEGYDVIRRGRSWEISSGGRQLAEVKTLDDAREWVAAERERPSRPQDSLDQGSLVDTEATVIDLPSRDTTHVAREESLVASLREAHAAQERATAELAAARQRRRDAAAGLRELGKSMSWIAGKIGVTQQAVDGFLKYKERKNRAGSAKALAALRARGLLAPAGPGAQVWRTPDGD